MGLSSLLNRTAIAIYRSAHADAHQVPPLSPLTRSAAIFALLVAACGGSEEQVTGNQMVSTERGNGQAGTFAGTGRDRFCLAEEGRAGFITYGQGDANCSLVGTVQRTDDRLIITPDGDATCRIEAMLAGDRVTLGEFSPACSYYCGPTASYAGKQFSRTTEPQSATDLAGDPLC